jgi:hypothetical protein
MDRQTRQKYFLICMYRMSVQKKETINYKNINRTEFHSYPNMGATGIIPRG